MENQKTRKHSEAGGAKKWMSTNPKPYPAIPSWNSTKSCPYTWGSNQFLPPLDIRHLIYYHFLFIELVGFICSLFYHRLYNLCIQFLSSCLPSSIDYFYIDFQLFSCIDSHLLMVRRIHWVYLQWAVHVNKVHPCLYTYSSILRINW